MIDRINQRLVATLTPLEKAFEVHDDQLKGFLLRVQPSGMMSYYYQYRLPSGARNRIKIETSAKVSPAQARDRAKEIAAEMVRGVDPKAAKKLARVPTIRKFILESYLEYAMANLKTGDANVKRVLSRFNEVLDYPLDDQRLAFRVENIKTQRVKSGVKKLTVNRDLTCLMAVFTFALRHKAQSGITQNPLADVSLFSIPIEETQRTRFLNQNDPDEEKRLFQALDDREKRIARERASANEWRAERGYELFPSLKDRPFVDHLKPLVILALNTGMRMGELLKLRFDDISWSSGEVELTVRGANAKNGIARRIPLNEFTQATLKHWMRVQVDHSGYMFPSFDRKPFKDIGNAWERVVEDAKLINFTFHALRHTFGTRLVLKKTDLNTVRELMGHKDIKMTLRYVHSSKQAKSEAVAKLNSAVGDT